MEIDDISPPADDRGVIEAARAIRPHLVMLVGAKAAAGLDRQLADALLDPVNPAERVGRLRDLLDADPNTSAFLAAVLEDVPEFRSPYQQPGHERRGPDGRPLGDISAVPADQYACPHGDYTWSRPDVGTPIPDCPTHQTRLVRS